MELKYAQKNWSKDLKFKDGRQKTKGLYFNADMVLDPVIMYKAVNIC